MCFSAPASFAAGAGLLAIGAVSISKSKTTPQRVLACIPLIFAVQQLSEGLLWVSLTQAAYARWQQIAMYTFLVFAEVVWPVFVPIAILLFEKERQRKRIIQALAGIGLLLCVYMSYSLVMYPVSASIEEHHIRYQLDFPFNNRWFSGIPYLLAAVLSPFISSLKPLRWLGGGFLAAYLVTRVWYAHYLISVWCFFAAILSVMVLFILLRLRRSNDRHQ